MSNEHTADLGDVFAGAVRKLARDIVVGDTVFDTSARTYRVEAVKAFKHVVIMRRSDNVVTHFAIDELVTVVPHRDVVTFAISGTASVIIDGSEISNDPVKYDGGSQGARDAYDALRAGIVRKAGRGYSTTVTATREGADTIRDYCQTVGEGFAMESDPETRADGRALLLVAERISKALGA